MTGTKLIIVFILVLFIAAPVKISAEPEKLQELMVNAFFRTFSEAAEFRNSEIFQLMGYSDGEIAEIGRITPRPASISVLIEPEAEPGHFRNIKVICQQVHYYNLVIERVTFEFPDCRLDMTELAHGRLRFLSGILIKLKTEVSQNDILKVFDFFARARSLSGLKLELESGQARLKGRVRQGFLVVEFRVQGDTHLLDNKTVMFKCRKLVLNGSPLPRNAINQIFAQINPVFDASKTWLNLNIASICIRPGFVETIATIEKKKG